MTLTRLIELLSSQPKERDALASIHDRLSLTMKRMVDVNERNKALLDESMDMLRFEMNLLQSMRHGPETNNYGRDAYISNNYALPDTKFDKSNNGTHIYIIDRIFDKVKALAEWRAYG